MGFCRGSNLLLGISVAPAALQATWPLALIPLVYITSVTAVSRGEVRGGTRRVLHLALVLIGGVLLALAAVVLVHGEASGLHATAQDGAALHTGVGLALVAWLGWRILPAFARAAATGSPTDIRRAVRTGVLSLVLIDAVLAAAYAGIMNSLAVLATGLLAWWLARLFAVT
jgi:4-hydroxybenzoate polyprenyltransferase